MRMTDTTVRLMCLSLKNIYSIQYLVSIARWLLINYFELCEVETLGMLQSVLVPRRWSQSLVLFFLHWPISHPGRTQRLAQ